MEEGDGMKKLLLIITVIILAIVADEILSWMFLLVGLVMFMRMLFKEAEK
jgi:hypothetical protein